MATTMVTAAMARKAEMLAGQAPTWHRGRSKETAREFFIIPASDGVSAHWTAVDGRACTCTGHRRRGVCTHALAAARLLADAPAASAQPAPAPLSCNDCGAELPAHVVAGAMCSECWNRREGIKQELASADRAAYKARLRASLGLLDEVA